jgi:TfoX/Sxy family transcriptional regulator of competence genes
VAYDEVLAARLRDALLAVAPEERRMFGALAWLVGGNLAVGVVGDDLLVRVPREEYDAALREPGARRFQFKGTGRVMSGFVVVDGEVLDDDVLRSWVERGVAYAASLPPK